MKNETAKTINLDNKQEMFRLWLQKQFTDRCKKNSKYSLRSFAKYLNIDPSTLSQILNGKRKISIKATQDLCNKLSATTNELQRFGLLEGQLDTDLNYQQLNLDMFSVISEWYHYAILELTFISGFKSDPKWIAKQLSITVHEAQSAIERLKRLGLLLEENNNLIKSSRRLTNYGSINTSQAHKELQRQILAKAQIAIDECPQEQKDITSMTMAIDPKNLDKAKLLIRNFRRELCELLEDGDQEIVYNLGIQLYPISNKKEHS